MYGEVSFKSRWVFSMFYNLKVFKICHYLLELNAKMFKDNF